MTKITGSAHGKCVAASVLLFASFIVIELFGTAVLGKSKREYDPDLAHQHDVTDPGFFTQTGEASAWAVTQDGKFWANAAATYQTVHVHPFSDGWMIAAFRGFGPNSTVTNLQFNGDGKILVALAQDKDWLMVYDVPGERTYKEVPADGRKLLSLSPYFLDNARIATGARDGRISIWDTESWSLDREFMANVPVYSIAVTEDGSSLYFSSDELKTVVHVDTTKPGGVLTPIKFERECGMPRSLKLSRNWLAVACLDTSIRAVDVTTNQQVGWMSGHEIPGVSFSFGEKILVSGGLDSNINVWELGTWKLVDHLPWIVHRYPLLHVRTNWEGTSVYTFNRDLVREWRRDPGGNQPTEIPERPETEEEIAKRKAEADSKKKPKASKAEADKCSSDGSETSSECSAPS